MSNVILRQEHTQQTEIPDLQKPGNSVGLPLSITDPTRYFEAQASVSTVALIPTEQEAAVSDDWTLKEARQDFHLLV